MTTFFIIIALLVVFIPALVLVHRFNQQRAERKSGRQVPTQGVVTKSVIATLGVFLVLLGFSVTREAVAAAWAAWTGVTLAGLGYCYWSLICLTESGRRYMILELVDRNPGITAEEIVRRYNRRQIIVARLDRLLHWGTLLLVSNRYQAQPTMMRTASRLVRWWAKLLGFTWATSATQFVSKKPNTS